MNVERIEAILRLLQRQPRLAEIEAEGEGWKLQARRAPGLPVPPPELLSPGTEEPPAPVRHVVAADRVGIFRCPKGVISPGAYLDEGAEVGRIDSMGILNPLHAGEAGYVVSVLVEEGEPVEYGQELIVLEVDAPAEESE